MDATSSASHYLERELYRRIFEDSDLFDFLQEGSLDGLWYWNLENPDHEWMSARFWELLGYDPSEKAHLASEWQAMIFPEDLEAALANLESHLADPNHPYDQIVRYWHKSGSTVWVRCRGIAIRDAAGRAIRMLGAHNDVTALKRAEEEVIALNACLEKRVAERTAELEQIHREKLELQNRVQETQRLESLAVLAGGIAHDFNNLLTVILGNTRLTIEQIGPDTPGRDRLERVRGAAEHAARLTEQMLTYAGKRSVCVGPTDVSELVAGIRDLLHTSTDGRAVLELRLAEDLPRVQADATQLRQVVLNLVTNASEAFEGSPGSIRVGTGTLSADETFLADCVGKHALNPGRYVFLEVSDTGRGLDTGHRASLFEPFFTTKFRGRGLGLSVVLGIVVGHGGGIKVAPTPGGGTTFTVLLPAVQGAGRAEAAKPRAAREPGSGPTILIVDDEEWVLEIAEAFLLHAGFGVVTASGGREAIEMVRADPDPYDAVVLDLAMPDLNGEQTLRELHRLRSDLPIILTSGYSQELASERFGYDGLSGFIGKPYTPDDLVAAVRNALAG